MSKRDEAFNFGHGQMTSTTPEPTPSLEALAPYQREGSLPSTDITHIRPVYKGDLPRIGSQTCALPTPNSRLCHGSTLPAVVSLHKKEENL
ncbi:hypothetical protein AVEN_72001-1 [Araneus ventricosus]|uniref:Uncharacterized protein n=1 Tax=Araneus ventricosus TaxID=182803 RepID=A0A4Y2DFU5_ARAVE|nr:hypothetical protein AVEN_72001-1 [Araneus ventricosus]